MRVCLDLSVLVAAFATRGLCADVLRIVLEDHELVIGEVLFEELERVLRSTLGLWPAQIAAVRGSLVAPDPVRRPSAPHPLTLGDPDDAWVVATAVDGRADVLVTGDAALLAAARPAPLSIVSPRGFWELLRARGPVPGGT